MNTRNIFVFKTTIKTDEDLKLIRGFLENDDRITEWSIDQDDIDNVLRIVGVRIQSENLTKNIEAKGFLCKKLAVGHVE